MRAPASLRAYPLIPATFRAARGSGNEVCWYCCASKKLGISRKWRCWFCWICVLFCALAVYFFFGDVICFVIVLFLPSVCAPCASAPRCRTRPRAIHRPEFLPAGRGGFNIITCGERSEKLSMYDAANGATVSRGVLGDEASRVV